KQGRKNFKIPKTKEASNLTLEECLEIIEKDSKGTKKPARKTATKTTTKKVSTKAKKE
ncbi:MAG: topoisomerase C-terminal repeat-containing protein, partial [Aliarcobacter cryaerophilus]|nr:topoisomerase C-terminal repeat-containing protein [Aliarcobacter cryaerophilus]